MALTGCGTEMGNNGSKKDKQKITPRDRAILDLKVQRDRLKQYQKKVRRHRQPSAVQSWAD